MAGRTPRGRPIRPPSPAATSSPIGRSVGPAEALMTDPTLEAAADPSVRKPWLGERRGGGRSGHRVRPRPHLTHARWDPPPDAPHVGWGEISPGVPGDAWVSGWSGDRGSVAGREAPGPGDL